MIRRSHKKSRQGCIECKRGHKKCDESRPSCVNCTIAKKQCSFTRKASHVASSRSPSDIEFVLSVTPDDLTQSRSPCLDASPSTSTPSRTATSTPPPFTPGTAGAEPYVNLLHLELFQNLTADGISFFPDNSSKDEWVSTVLRYTFSYPYLMYEALALSALRLSIIQPTRSHLLLTESTTLQAHALSLFNATNSTSTSNPPSPSPLNQESLNAAFLFSGLLGLHFFCDTFLTPSPSLDSFLDRLVQAIHLLRGIRALVGTSWSVIKTSDIACLLDASEPPLTVRDDEITEAFENLFTTFSNSRTISAYEAGVYVQAIKGLLKVYNSQPQPWNGGVDGNGNRERVRDGPGTDPRLVMAWPIEISAEYAELLRQRKPEALVVMGYFSILLYQRRTFWAVGEAGRYLLGAIEEYLGEEWREELAVPRGMMELL